MLTRLLRALGFGKHWRDPIQPWDLSRRLFSFSKSDELTLARACEGVLIMGATGAGKSSASGRSLALSYLAAGFGGIVFAAKSDEVQVWKEYARRAGRSNDVVIFSPDNPWRFNFLDFELQRKGRGAGLTENLRKLLSTISEITKHDSGKGGGQEDGAYWEDSKNQLLRNLIDLVIMAKGRITVGDLYEVLNSAAKSIEQTRSAEWQQNSACFQYLKEAYHRPKSKEQQEDFRVIDNYWMAVFPELAEKTRSIVASTFTAMTDVLHRGLLKTLFCGETNITPQALEEGKIVIVDLPITEFSEIGLYAAAIWKFCTQQSLQRRDVAASPRPVFMWCDEAQHFVLSSDSMFQTTCRSYKVSTVLLTQNISNFYAQMGGQSSESLVDSLFGNLNTKIFHSNGDFKTNQWMADLIGKARMHLANASSSRDPSDGVTAALGIGASRTTAGVSEVFEYLVQPSAATKLRTGGPANAWLVDSIIVRSGSCFHATGRPYLFCTFSQKQSNR
jgi:type IV secretory pathway TraG/TraD family ATPase VirD4